MPPVNTQVSLPYNNTNYTTDLYRISRAINIAPAFDTTFHSIDHRRRDF